MLTLKQKTVAMHVSENTHAIPAMFTPTAGVLFTADEVQDIPVLHVFPPPGDKQLHLVVIPAHTPIQYSNNGTCHQKTALAQWIPTSHCSDAWCNTTRAGTKPSKKSSSIEHQQKDIGEKFHVPASSVTHFGYFQSNTETP